MQYFTELQIHPDEVEDDGEVMLNWDFNIDKINLSFTASQSSVKTKIPSSVNTIYALLRSEQSKLQLCKVFEAGKSFVVVCCFNSRFPVTKLVVIP